MKPPTVLVFDEQAIWGELSAQIMHYACRFIYAATLTDGCKRLKDGDFDIVLVSVYSCREDELVFCELVQTECQDVPLILSIPPSNKKMMWKAFQLGAFGVVDPSFANETLESILSRAYTQCRLLKQRRLIELLSVNINAQESLKNLLDFLSGHLCTTLKVEKFSLFLYNQKNETLMLTCTNHVPLPVNTTLSLRDLGGVMREVIDSFSPSIVDKKDSSVKYIKTTSAQKKRYISNTSAAIPLLIRGKLIGILNLNDKKEVPENFDDVDVSFLVTAGEHIASAIAVRQETNKFDEAQKMYLQAQRLAQNAVLVASIGHEIKTPITSLHFATTNLERELNADKPINRAKCHRYLAALHRDINRIRDRVDDFLQFAAPRETEESLCNAKDVVTDAVDQVGVQAKELGIKMTCQIKKKIPLVRVDIQDFLQAVLNLLVNAIEASQCGDAIDVVLESFEKRVFIRVSDEGTGIEPEAASRIYELFYTTKAKGSGIGLSQVYKFCVQHKGAVSFSSKSKGTTFTLELPVRDVNNE